MTEPISIDFIEEIARQYGYWAVFFGISLENAGIPLPGETITIVGGFLAGEGELKYEGVLGCAIAGAILGDNFGYWLGKTGGWSLLLRLGRLFRVEESRLEMLRAQFSANAAKAVFFGRFVALLRVFAGPLAGIAQMPYGSFFLCNAAGAVVWALVIVTLAFTLGQIIPLEQLLEYISEFGFWALVLVIVGFVAIRWLKSRHPLSAEVGETQELTEASHEVASSEVTPTSVRD
ncbi:MAG: DedA family protein [Geitlerinemataceae cyanobacterium]